MKRALLIGDKYDFIVTDGDRTFKLRDATLIDIDLNFWTIQKATGEQMLINVRDISIVERKGGI